METRRANPVLASHAERARRRVVAEVRGQLNVLVAQMAIPENRETKRSSKQSKADKR